MATFDQLPAEQRAIIELVLQREQSYAELSDMLGMTPARVRELARDALIELSPRSAERVDPDWRGQLADYLLNQQSGPESTATRGHLKRSEAARSWALSLLDALDALYADGRPAIPDADAGPRRRDRSAALADRSRRRERRDQSRERRDAERPPRASAPLSPAAASAVRRRRIIAIAAGVALLAFGIWFLFIRGGDDDDDGNRDAAEKPVNVVGTLPLRAQSGERGEGQAFLAEQGGRLRLVVAAAGLRPNERGRNRSNPGDAYEVWLYNSDGDARSIGAQVTDQQGNYQGAGPLNPEQLGRYRFIDVSREKIDRNAKHSGQSVLRGRLSQIQRPPAAQGGGQGQAPQQGQPQQGQPQQGQPQQGQPQQGQPQR